MLRRKLQNTGDVWFRPLVIGDAEVGAEFDIFIHASVNAASELISGDQYTREPLLRRSLDEREEVLGVGGL
jgi:hypothetical protein